MSDVTNPAAAQVAAPAADAQQAPAQPAQAVAAQPAPPVKPEPRKLPYAAPVRGSVQPATVAQPASSEPAKDESKGKPVASRALAMAKSNAAKLTAELEAARKEAGQVKAMRSVLAGYAEEAVKPLPAEWQAHLKELAGDDPAKLLELVSKTAHLRVAPAATPAAPVPQKLPSTAPVAPSPAANAIDGDLAALAQYEQLKRAGKSILAASYAVTHSAEIARAQAKRGNAHN